MGCGASEKQVTTKKNTSDLLNGKTEDKAEKVLPQTKDIVEEPRKTKDIVEPPRMTKDIVEPPRMTKDIVEPPMHITKDIVEPPKETPQQKEDQICPYVDNDTFNKIKASFKKVDENGTGSLSVKELVQGMAEFNISMEKDDIIRLLRIIDTNFDSMLSQREYVRFMLTVIVAGNTQADSLAEFISADTDLSGNISQAEFKKLATRLYKDKVSRKVYDEVLGNVKEEMEFKEFQEVVKQFE